MPLYPMDDTYLNQLCYYLTQQEYIYYPWQKNFLLDLWNTGCRPMELITTDHFYLDGDGNFACITEKSGALRHFPGTFNPTLGYITSPALSNDKAAAVNFVIKAYQGLTRRQLTQVTYKIIPIVQPVTDNKSAINYIFRYNYQKQLHLSGYSDDDIKTIMAYESATMPSNYYNKQLYSKSTLPSLPSAPIPWQP